ncbi:hypothetical protein C8Q79DRAFT_700147 [Trametes meyenii]|nr:hypothetical protein C8Q79DRAFT_700147 [Trametes meyenii]
MPPRKEVKTTATRASTRIASAAASRARAPLSAAKDSGVVDDEIVAHSAPENDANVGEGEQVPDRSARVPVGSAFQAPREGFLNLPLDILLEIFGLLPPYSLLALARTSKDLRTFLTSRKSAACWKSARQQLIDFPECPSDLAEPQYAQLVFGDECHALVSQNCGRRANQPAVLALRVHYCTRCAVVMMVKEQTIRALINKVEKVSSRKDAVLGTTYISSKHDYSRYCCKDEVDSLKAGWASLKTAKERKRFAEHRMDMVLERNKHASMVASWSTAERQRKEQEMDALTKSRYKQAVRFLKTEGWREDIRAFSASQLTHLAACEELRIPRLLDEKEWLSIRSRVTDYIIKLRDRIDTNRAWDRQRDQRIELMYAALAAHRKEDVRKTATSDLLAVFADLAGMPAFGKLLLAPMTVNVTLQDFSSLLECIPAVQAEWLQARECDFRCLITKHVEVAEGVDPLSLAVATYRCTVCKRTGMRWPNVLAHKCLRPECNVDTPVTNWDAIATLCAEKGLPFVWRLGNPPKVTFDRGTFTKMCVAIRVCGLDPQRATYEDMERCGLRLFCGICSDPSVGYQQVYDWQGTLSHKRPRCDVLFGPSKKQVYNKWQILDATHTETVLVAEAALRAKSNNPPNAYGCVRCPFRSKIIPSEHCTAVHGIAKPRLGNDYYVHLDSVSQTRGPTITINIYPEYARTGRTAVKDVREGRGFFSPSLFAS